MHLGDILHARPGRRGSGVGGSTVRLKGSLGGKGIFPLLPFASRLGLFIGGQEEAAWTCALTRTHELCRPLRRSWSVPA